MEKPVFGSVIIVVMVSVVNHRVVFILIVIQTLLSQDMGTQYAWMGTGFQLWEHVKVSIDAFLDLSMYKTDKYIHSVLSVSEPTTF